MYIINTMSKEQFKVTKSEYEAIMLAEKGVFIPRIEVFINKSFIASAYPESIADNVEDRKELKSGFLHDGTRVRDCFGKWIIAESDEDFPISPDPEYYPEIKLGLIFSEKEYHQLKEFSIQEKLTLLLEKDNRSERLNQEKISPQNFLDNAFNK